MSEAALKADCCIAGGGPAGMMLGYLLARAGVSVVMLERHADFLRDFRGDTIHPSTLELMHELGLLDRFLSLPHQKTYRLSAEVGNETVTVADFSHLPVQCPYIAFMPQWDFLNFLAEAGQAYPGFRLLMNVEAHELIDRNGRIAGVRARTPKGGLEVEARLVVGADGRQSTIRRLAGLQPTVLGAPMDVLWFSLPRSPDDPDQTMGRFDIGRIFIMINRGDYWQCGFVIAKGSADQVRGRGLPAFREIVGGLAPFTNDRLAALDDWDQIKLLTVGVDRLETWHRPGLLCIGDAAHTMSPVGGVGINLAVQDAVAAANILCRPLLDGTLNEGDLAEVQKRRLLPVRIIQRLQVVAQNRIIRNVLDGSGPLAVPAALRLFQLLPFLRRLPARLIGLGIRREHVKTPNSRPAT